MWRLMSAEQLEKQYQPSQWTEPAQERHQAVEKFIKHCQHHSQLAHNSICCVRGVTATERAQCRTTQLSSIVSEIQQQKHDPLEYDTTKLRQQVGSEIIHTGGNAQQNRKANKNDNCPIPTKREVAHQSAAVKEKHSETTKQNCAFHLHKVLWDEFGAHLPPTAPLIVFIHGGYWQEMSGHLSAAPALSFSAHMRHRCLIVHYPLAPHATLRQIVAHVRQVGRNVRDYMAELRQTCSSTAAQVGADETADSQTRQHVVLIGHSAGAQLAAAILADWSRSRPTTPTDNKSMTSSTWLTDHGARQNPSDGPSTNDSRAKSDGEPSNMAAAHESLVVDAVMLSGVYDLEPLVSTSINDALQLSTEAARHLSPVSHSGALSAWRQLRKILVLVGERDSPEFRRQARQYAQAINSSTSRRCHTDSSRSEAQPNDIATDNRSKRSGDQVAEDKALLHVIKDHDHFSICQSLADPKSDVISIIRSQLLQQ